MRLPGSPFFFFFPFSALTMPPIVVSVRSRWRCGRERQLGCVWCVFVYPWVRVHELRPDGRQSNGDKEPRQPPNQILAVKDL